MHPSHWAEQTPDKPAIIVAETGEAVSYKTMNDRANQVAQLLRASGLGVGDALAIMMSNTPRFYDFVWGSQRSGTYFTPVPNRLTAGEAGYIVRDCGAKIFVITADLAHLAQELRADAPDAELYYLGDPGDADMTGWSDFDAKLAQMPATPIADERAGADTLYSSGTTGRPKGIRAPLPETGVTEPNILTNLMAGMFGFTDQTVYLSPAPLYHAAPLRWSANAQMLGGTIVLMKKFDPEAALAHIETYKVTSSQWVPTHFVRMLKLPEDVRKKYDTSSLKMAIHAAAPCPVEVKKQMIAWWGPVLFEYYAGSEGFGLTMVGSAEWMQKPGTVGRAVSGIAHVCNEKGEELGPNETGVIYFENDNLAEYHGDPKKTAEARNAAGWATYGDIGHLDEDGFLFLTDRKSFMIISGGVNVYPQEIEDALVLHPHVADAAVIGTPDDDLGERVTAVVQPAEGAPDESTLRDDLTVFLRERLSGVKVPKQIDFREELPRLPTGKLQKRLLVDEYKAAAS